MEHNALKGSSFGMTDSMHAWCEAKVNACHWIAVHHAGIHDLSLLLKMQGGKKFLSLDPAYFSNLYILTTPTRHFHSINHEPHTAGGLWRVARGYDH